jgi:ribosomal protein S18 acetylase RimI-like enzyme
MKLKYRVGTNDDKKELQTLGLVAYGEFKNILTTENWDKLNLFLTAENSYSDLLKISRCFICECGDELIGMAFLVPKGNPTEIFQADWSYIRMVGVNPNFTGHGIAKTLTGMCLDFAWDSKERIVALHTSEFMDAARHIYESFGFRQTRELEPRLGKRYWLYQLDLANYDRVTK